MESQPRCKAQRPQDAQRVLRHAGAGLPHRADQALLQVFDAAYMVHQACVRVPGQGVDGEVPPQHILFQGAGEGDRVRVPAVAVGAVLAVGGDLNGHALPDQGEGAVLEPNIQQLFPGQGGLHFLRRCLGGDVKVRGTLTQAGIPDAAAHQISLKARIVQASQGKEDGGREGRKPG